MKREARSFFIVGGAGFIGSHFTDFLLSRAETSRLTIYDNFSSGRKWHYEAHLSDPRLKVVTGDVKDLTSLASAMEGHEVVIHLASNPDIARAAKEPNIDFVEGTLLTQNVVEAMRITGTPHILYASGSGIYGDLGTLETAEDYGPLLPISTYGASKLAGESLICSYSFMFGITGFVFRFGNVVGPRQTHGVGYDFMRSLIKNPHSLRILGDGTQSKSYIHVEDVCRAVMFAFEKTPESFRAYNVATLDYITVKEIADIAVECQGLSPSSVRYEFTGGNRGWKGDVPVMRLNTQRIRNLGWRNERTCREALKHSMLSLKKDVDSGRIQSG